MMYEGISVTVLIRSIDCIYCDYGCVICERPQLEFNLDMGNEYVNIMMYFIPNIKMKFLLKVNPYRYYCL